MTRRGLEWFIGIAGAPTVWAIHFLAVYIYNGLACARGFAASLVLGIPVVPVGLAVATAAALAAIVLPGWTVWRRAEPGFLKRVAVLLSVLSIVAVLWQGLLVLMVPPCA